MSKELFNASNFLGFIIHDEKSDDFVLRISNGSNAVLRFYDPNPANAQRFKSFKLANNFLKRFGRPSWEIVSLHDFGFCYVIYRDYRS